MRGEAALDLLLREYEFQTVLDVGSGDGRQAARFRDAGKYVDTVSLIPPAKLIGSFPEVVPVEWKYDVIWASHVLEHQRNPGAFLDACIARLAPNGVLAVTVPPEKPQLVGGHLTTWTSGRLLYHLILAGCDCRKARVYAKGYDLSVVVRYEPVTLPALVMDNGDIERLAPFFPVRVSQGCDGRIGTVNWS